MLKLRTIHLNHCARIAEKNFGGGFYHARFAGTGWPEKEKISYWAAGRVQAGTKNLVQLHERLDAFLLPDNLCSQRRLKIQRIGAALARIK
jgi:hypothetical protein